MTRTDVSLSRLSLPLLQLHIEANKVVLARDDHDRSSILTVDHAGEEGGSVLDFCESGIAERGNAPFGQDVGEIGASLDVDYSEDNVGHISEHLDCLGLSSWSLRRRRNAALDLRLGSVASPVDRTASQLMFSHRVVSADRVRSPCALITCEGRGRWTHKRYLARISW